MDLKRRTFVKLSTLVEQLTYTLEKINLTEYIEYLNDRKRMLWTSFLSGLAKGFGAAIGFTLLGALVIFILTETAVANLPGLGSFIAKLVEIVQNNLRK